MKREEIVITKRWTGTVLDVGKETFFARLEDVQTKALCELFISKDQVFSSCQAFILPGVSFIWEIGYSETDQKRTPLSLIKFSPSK